MIAEITRLFCKKKSGTMIARSAKHNGNSWPSTIVEIGRGVTDQPTSIGIECFIDQLSLNCLGQRTSIEHGWILQFASLPIGI